MPQLTMSEDPSLWPWLGLRLAVSLRPAGEEGIDIVLQGLTHKREWATIWIARQQGLELDLLPSLASEVVNAWMFGERKDVLTTAARSHKAARAHAREHTY